MSTRVDVPVDAQRAAMRPLVPPTWLGTLPFLLLLVAWWLLPRVVQYPSYMLPPISAVLDFAWDSIRDGTLVVPGGPGWGCDVVEDVLRAHSVPT